MLKKVIHIILIVAILVSSSGLLISKHYCLDELIDVALFSEAESCQESEVVVSIPTTSEQEAQHKNCCKDEVTFIKVEEPATKTIADFSFEKPFIAWAIIRLALNIPTEKQNISAHKYQTYTPPFLVCDFTISLQTFLC